MLHSHFKAPLILLSAVVQVLFLTACVSPTPDLARLYQFAGDSEVPPVILIHGAFGSRLVDAGGEELWPGSLKRLMTGDYRDIALSFDDDLMPVDEGIRVAGITEKIAGQDYYGRIREVLENVGGYSVAHAGDKVNHSQRRYYVFEYDWRRDNVQTSRKLHKFLDQIRVDYDDPSLRFDVVAHSMGGLVTRYFARYGSVDVLDDNEFPVNGSGAEYLRRVVLLGTPNLGSVTSVKNLISGMKFGFNRIPTEVLVTFPSAYQLLPHPLNKWLYTSTGKYLERDVFATSIWRAFEFSIFNPEVEARIRAGYVSTEVSTEVSTQASTEEADAAIAKLQAYFDKHIERGRRFVWSLTVPADNVDTRYVVFGGDCHLTPTRLVVEEVDGVSTICLSPDDIKNKTPGVDYERLMLEPGDGTVSKASLQSLSFALSCFPV
jgi:pimeloyl-ACP methyl ester carboxylesterase